MYFDNFKDVLYQFPEIGSDKSNKSVIIKDITSNIRFKKEFIENLPLVETYKIQEGDTPELISEKLYGTPEYHWILMLLNQRYDHISDFPLSSLALDYMIENKYGTCANLANHFVDSHNNKTNGYCYINSTANVTGTITASEAQVIGTDTSFLSQLAIGNELYTIDGNYVGTIKTIISDTELVLSSTMGYVYTGEFNMKIVFDVGDVLRNKTNTGYAVGVVKVVNPTNVAVLLMSSSFAAGRSVEVFKYTDNLGNYAEIYKGVMFITKVTYIGSLKIITNYDHEYLLNENLRALKILHKAYLDQVMIEFKSLMLQ